MPHTDWFTSSRFGLFIHWGLYAIPARGEWIKNQERITDEAHQPYFDEFNPTRYDARAWARAAKAAGQQYAVITTKHHDGFCLFDSKLTDYKATNTPIAKDLIREYVDAFRAEGLKVGFYYSLLDWHHPKYPVDRLHPLRDIPENDPRRKNRSMPDYVDYLHGQVRELLTNYGKIDILWFDFSYDNNHTTTWRARELVDMIRSLQPGIILNNRLTTGHADPTKQKAGGGSPLGDLATPEQIIPPQGVTDSDGNLLVWEACMTLNNHWGYCRDDHNFKNPAEVVQMLVECVSKGGNLLLNVGPTAKGEIQPEALTILARVGEWLRLNGESVYNCSRATFMNKPDWGRYTLSADGKKLYAHLFTRPMGPIVFENLAGKVKHIRYLADGSELKLGRPWNVPEKWNHVSVNLPATELPDDLSTVLEITLA